MISNKILKNKIKNLKGFVNKKTVNKYIKRNQKLSDKLIKKKYTFNPNKILFFLILFCGSLFTYHLYTLWKKYQKEKVEKVEKVEKIQLKIIPKSGIY